MTVMWKDLFWGTRYLRQKCFIIGYLNFIVGFVNLACNVVILMMVTNVFSCDVDLTALRSIKWPWLEPFLVIINIGTHDFYPFPLSPRYYAGLGMPSTPRCYPGMLHIHVVDQMNILFHLFWLRLALSYIEALQKKDIMTMRWFFRLSVVKILLQMLSYGYNPFFYSKMFNETRWFINIIDLCVAVYFLLIISSYLVVVTVDKTTPAPVEADHPPSYIECQMPTVGETNEKPPEIAVDIENKVVT